MASPTTIAAPPKGIPPGRLTQRTPLRCLVADVGNDPTLGDLRAIISNEGIQALAFVPLVHHGSLLGKFMLYYAAPHQFTNNEVQLAQTIAGHIAIAVARRYDEEALSSARIAATMAAERAEFLAEISRVLATSLDYTQTLASLARATVPFLADACVIYQLVDRCHPASPGACAHRRRDRAAGCAKSSASRSRSMPIFLSRGWCAAGQPRSSTRLQRRSPSRFIPTPPIRPSFAGWRPTPISASRLWRAGER